MSVLKYFYKTAGQIFFNSKKQDIYEEKSKEFFVIRLPVISLNHFFLPNN
jgi:hypothetical protein